jgi:hypothetical protein
LWCAAGGFWTWHSWDGCEGINDLAYRAPGEEFLKPLAESFRALPFWQFAPNFTACMTDDKSLVQASLATADRSTVISYICTPETGREVKSSGISLRLPAGRYSLQFIRAADGTILASRSHESSGLGSAAKIAVPDFMDDLAVLLKRTQIGKGNRIPETQ